MQTRIWKSVSGKTILCANYMQPTGPMIKYKCTEPSDQINHPLDSIIFSTGVVFHFRFVEQLVYFMSHSKSSNFIISFWGQGWKYIHRNHCVVRLPVRVYGVCVCMCIRLHIIHIVIDIPSILALYCVCEVRQSRAEKNNSLLPPNIHNCFANEVCKLTKFRTCSSFTACFAMCWQCTPSTVFTYIVPRTHNTQLAHMNFYLLL